MWFSGKGCGVHVAIPVTAITLTIYGLLMRTVEIITIYQHSDHNGPKSRITEDGKFCVIPYVTVATGDQGLSNVTLVTQGSIGYLGKLATSCSLWQGPISAALYLPSHKHLTDALSLIHFLSLCHPEFERKVSAHLFYPVKNTSQCLEFYQHESVFKNDINCSHVFSSLNALPTKRIKWYPVNTARNIARNGAKTDLLLIADIELYPSENLSLMFDDFYRRRSKPLSTKEVFVIPVFEVLLNQTMPKTKSQLNKLVLDRKAVPFHIDRIAYECHKIPGLAKWWSSGNESFTEIGVYKSTKWIRPCWEPVFISDNDTPLHDERFRGYGKNKIQQV